jgi:hypothetical protein
MSSRTSIQINPGAPSGSLIPSSLAALADPPIRQIDAAVMDYFLIELVNTLRDSAAVATRRAKKIEQDMVEAGLIPPPAPPSLNLPPKKESARDSVTSLTRGSGKSSLDDEEEAVRSRLETIGLHVGANFTERCVTFHLVSFRRLTQNLSGYVEIGHYSQKLWTRSSLYAKRYGRRVGISRWTIYGRTIGCAARLFEVGFDS